jgi:hypothetical protein
MEGQEREALSILSKFTPSIQWKVFQFHDPFQIGQYLESVDAFSSPSFMELALHCVYVSLLHSEKIDSSAFFLLPSISLVKISDGTLIPLIPREDYADLNLNMYRAFVVPVQLVETNGRMRMGIVYCHKHGMEYFSPFPSGSEPSFIVRFLNQRVIPYLNKKGYALPKDKFQQSNVYNLFFILIRAGTHADQINPSLQYDNVQSAISDESKYQDVQQKISEFVKSIGLIIAECALQHDKSSRTLPYFGANANLPVRITEEVVKYLKTTVTKCRFNKESATMWKSFHDVKPRKDKTKLISRIKPTSQWKEPIEKKYVPFASLDHAKLPTFYD